MSRAPRTLVSLVILGAAVPSVATAAPAPKPGWNKSAVLAPAGPSYSRLTVAVSRQGDAAVGWLREATCCTGTGRLEVRFRRRATGPFTRPRTLELSGARLPHVSISQVAEPLVVWVAGASIKAAARERGEPWRTWTVASKTSDVVSLRGAIDVTGTATVVWVQQPGAGAATVRSASTTLDGADTPPWTADTQFVAPNGPVSTAVGARGWALAAWPMADGSIEHTIRTPSTGAWAAVKELAPPGSAVPAATVRVDIAPLGQAIAAWFGDGAQQVQASYLADPSAPSWEAPYALTAAAPGLFSNLAVSIDNGAAVSWAANCVKGGKQPVGAAHRTGASANWRIVPSPPVLSCGGEDLSVVSRLGIVRGPRLVMLAPLEVSVGPDTAVGAQTTLGGLWQRGALPGEQSVAEMDASGRVGLFVWARPEDGTALRWRQYLAP